MSEGLEANKDVVERLIKEGFSDGNLDVVGELVSPEVVTHNPIILDAPSGADSIRGGIEMIHHAFTDISVELRDIVAEDDKVATFLQISGTNVGEYRRGGATNQRTSFRAFFIWRLDGGRVVENWGVADRFDALQQLGIIPSDDELGEAGRAGPAAGAG